MKKIMYFLWFLTIAALSACGKKEESNQLNVELVAEDISATSQVDSDVESQESTQATQEVVTQDTDQTDNSGQAAEEQQNKAEANATAENSAAEGWKAAYLKIVDQLSQGEGNISFDLIYFDGDDIPELVAGNTGYYVSMYTYDDGQIYTLMDEWAYGAFGNAGYEYVPKKNLMRNYNSDYAGLVMYTTYSEISGHEVMPKYYLKTSYEDENGEVLMVESDEDIVDENWHYYEGNPAQEKQISLDEFNSKVIEDNFMEIMGTKSADQMKADLQ